MPSAHSCCGVFSSGGTAVSQIKHGVGVPEIVDHILSAWSKATGSQKRPLKQQRT